MTSQECSVPPCSVNKDGDKRETDAAAASTNPAGRIAPPLSAESSFKRRDRRVRFQDVVETREYDVPSDSGLEKCRATRNAQAKHSFFDLMARALQSTQDGAKFAESPPVESASARRALACADIFEPDEARAVKTALQIRGPAPAPAPPAGRSAFEGWALAAAADLFEPSPTDLFKRGLQSTQASTEHPAPPPGIASTGRTLTSAADLFEPSQTDLFEGGPQSTQESAKHPAPLSAGFASAGRTLASAADLFEPSQTDSDTRGILVDQMFD